MPTTQRPPRFTAAMLVGLAVFAFDARAANDNSKDIYNAIAVSIYQSASQIFICLSNGKKKDLQSTKLATDALEGLNTASKRLWDLKGWDNEKFDAPDAVTAALVRGVAAELNVPPEDFKSVHVRTYAIRAVEDMARLIGDWKDCSAPFKSNADYIKFIGAKIKLERATLLSEIAYVPKR